MTIHSIIEKRITYIYRKHKITFRWNKWQGNKGHWRDHFPQNSICELVRNSGQQTFDFRIFILLSWFLWLFSLWLFVDLHTGIRFFKMIKVNFKYIIIILNSNHPFSLKEIQITKVPLSDVIRWKLALDRFERIWTIPCSISTLQLSALKDPPKD